MEKKYFTKEQLKKLEVAEYHFATAVNSNYKRGTMRQMNEMLADEYEKATGEKLNRNWSCANCCLNNFKVIGRLYFESKKHYEEEEQHEPQQLVFNFDAVDTEPEPAPENKPSTKTVTGDIDQVQNTPTTEIPVDTQQVQEETEVKQTKSKVFNKNKAGRPKKQK